MSSEKSPIHDEWIFANNSDVFVTNSKSSFTTFTDFKTHLGTLTGHRLDVIGIGNVILDAKTSTTRKGSKSHQPLLLQDVLYAPDAVCNILGSPILHRFNVYIEAQSGRIEDRTTKKTVALLERGAANLYRLKLKGQPGAGTRKDDGMYMINAQWSEGERMRWKLACQQREAYTDSEKKFIKEHFKSEYHFLRMHALRMYNEEDRAEGREILRALMREDSAEEFGHDQDNVEAMGSSSAVEDDDEDDANSFEEDLENEPMSHLADHRFSETQLDWIKKHYRHSMNFLMSYGLRPYDDYDCDEGVSIIESMMYDDGD